jgi:hypothetical protein
MRFNAYEPKDDIGDIAFKDGVMGFKPTFDKDVSAKKEDWSKYIDFLEAAFNF